MHKLFIAAVLITACYSSCKKDEQSPTTPAPVTNNPPPQDTTKPVDSTNGYVTYLIKRGNNYMENNSYPTFGFKEMHFSVIFDSSCIYYNVDPVNQLDINKLMGFADCSSFHQVNSARFGWNWVDDSLRLHAYCYSNSVRSYKELGAVSLGKPQDCVLKVMEDKYIFVLNGKADTMARGCTDTVAHGYKLYPYFGGDETAPHDIRIKVKEY